MKGTTGDHEPEKGPAGRKETAGTPCVEVRSFGAFELYVDGTPVHFRQARCKELLAYLVDRQGGSVTRREAFAILYEDRPYDRTMQKRFDVVIRSLRGVLAKYGISDLFVMERATMRVCPRMISCDAWRFFEADPDTVSSYNGEYMTGYAWAKITEGHMTERFQQMVENPASFFAPGRDKTQTIRRPEDPVSESVHICIRTFGNFDLLVDNVTVTFARAKAKELLACLVDMRGSGVSRKQAFHILWEEEEYNRSAQKKLDVIIRSLRDTLREYGAGRIFEMEKGILRIRPDLFDCDLYRLLAGETDAINEYRGEYMNNYSWARLTEGLIGSRKKEERT